MPPNQANDGYTPRYRQFAPQSIVWVQNPFDHDVEFQVADELNRPFMYVLPSHKVSELPGGSVATLGVKKIVDELIQNSEKDTLSIWDLPIRAKYEEQVIVREKDAPSRTEQTTAGGTIDLSVKSTEVAKEEVSTKSSVKEKPEEFPDLKKVPPSTATSAKQANPDVQATMAGLPASSLVEG